MSQKNPNAVALGSLGGEARARSTTAKQREKWGRLGGQARAAKYDKATLRKWAKMGGRPRKSKKP